MAALLLIASEIPKGEALLLARVGLAYGLAYPQTDLGWVGSSDGQLLPLLHLGLVVGRSVFAWL